MDVGSTLCGELMIGSHSSEQHEGGRSRGHRSAGTNTRSASPLNGGDSVRQSFQAITLQNERGDVPIGGVAFKVGCCKGWVECS